MTLHDLAGPLRIEQIGEALRRFFRLHQLGVVADHAQPDSPAREQAVRILVLRRVVESDVLGHVRREDALALPDDEVRGVRAVHHVDRMDVAPVFLPDALEDPLAARPLHAHGDARVLRLERLGDTLRHRKVHGGVPDRLAFLLRRLDQLRRDLARRRARRPRPPVRQQHRERGDGESPEELALADVAWLHEASGALQDTSALHRSGGRVSQTEAPGAKLSAAAAVIRSCVPSGASTT